MKNVFLIFFAFLSLNIFGQAGDCPGLCITSNGTYAATNGSTNELNASNRGCLTANEASSSFWFQVCFTSNGTFQFYIDPSGNRNDFDFAIWNTTTCPPTTAPIRCSWAAVPPGGPCPLCDYTGLGTNPITSVLATDVSEGASGDGWLAPLSVIAGQCITININNYGAGSNNFTINLGGTTAGMTCATLPIELLSFNGSVGNNFNLIQWSTATEINNDYFTLERSVDGLNWEEIANVNGAGNSSVTLNYSFRDYGYVPGISYYRLSQTDYNGSREYFHIIAVDNTKTPKTIVRVTNMMGQDVDNSYEGLRIIYYSDGTIIKKVGR